MQGATRRPKATSSEARVVLISPYALPRLGLARLLETIDGVEVVAHASSTRDGARMCQEYRPDLVIVDAELADEEGMVVVGQLKRNGSRVGPSDRPRVVLLAAEATHSQVERALEAGADGITLKDISIQELGSTLSRVADGDTVLHPHVASALARRYATNGRGSSLTPRQHEILRLIAEGLENKQIARRLGIGLHTVKTHVSRVLHKLGANSRTEAVVLAMKERLIS
jgi:DNA-binding NarL/FixJ family response regulator